MTKDIIHAHSAAKTASGALERQPYLRAFDLDTGNVLAEMPLAGDPGGNPISYMVGERQYLVFPINDDHGVPQLLALALSQ